MEGIKGYSRPGKFGGVTVDTESMLVDLITVYKAAGKGKEEFLAFAAETWEEVKVEVKYPRNG